MFKKRGIKEYINKREAENWKYSKEHWLQMEVLENGQRNCAKKIKNTCTKATLDQFKYQKPYVGN